MYSAVIPVKTIFILKKLFSCILFLLCVALSTRAQERRTEVYVDFRVNETVLELGFNNNRARVDSIVKTIGLILNDRNTKLLELHFAGSASPEGSFQLNTRLSKDRLLTLEEFVRARVEIPDSIIMYDENYIPWDSLKALVVASEKPYAQKVVEIIDAGGEIVDYLRGEHIDSRVLALRKLEGGKVWNDLNKIFFSRLRNACVVFVTYENATLLAPSFKPLYIPEVPVSAVVPKLMPVKLNTFTEEWVPKLHIKTNAIGWGMLISNIAVEADVAQHWSVSLPLYYSALNYFTSTVKFRTFTVQPEARYWFNPENTGLFVGAHLGMSFYNVAVNSSKRVQDHNGNSPALGGGLSVGYRMPLSKDKRWNVEFTAGAGIYSQHYDEFINEPNGLELTTKKGAYTGIDNIAVTFSYSLDLKKKGGRR